MVGQEWQSHERTLTGFVPSQSRSGRRRRSYTENDLDPKKLIALEKNRLAALKYRQNKRNRLKSLAEQAEHYTQENQQLKEEANELRDEIIQLKTLLMAHMQCPIAIANGLVNLI